ncbi:CA10 (predicted) [Pycnogonum litorale]
MRNVEDSWQFVFFVAIAIQGVLCSWDEWWAYDGISGPSYWGLLNPEWSMCTKGKRQSPINIQPDRLLYDENLNYLMVDKHRVNGVIKNTGHSVIFSVEESNKHAVNISRGPLSYKYTFSELHIHYGISDDVGSEHTVNGYAFPAELQLYGYNTHLYHNISEAIKQSQGLVAISVVLQLGEQSNHELRILTSHLGHIKYKDESYKIRNLSPRGLLPDTDFYMTYEGSTTLPGCYEAVTWIVMNKPIYITKQQLYALRQIMQGTNKMPKGVLGDNFRTVMPVNNRAIRTNIESLGRNEKGCLKSRPKLLYKANAYIGAP